MRLLGIIVLDSLRRDDGASATEVLLFLENVLSLPNADSEIENAVAISFLDLGQLDGCASIEPIPCRVRQVLFDQARRDQGAT